MREIDPDYQVFPANDSDDRENYYALTRLYIRI